MKSPTRSLLAGSLLFLFCACKKGDTNSAIPAGSRTEMLLGKWTVEATGTDLNGNDSLEVPEYDSSDPGLIAFLTYRANNTGFAEEIYLGRTLISGNFTWQLANNDQSLIRVLEGDTLIYALKTLTPIEVRGFVKLGSYKQHFLWRK